MVIGIGAGVFPGSRSSVFGETRGTNTQASNIAVLQQASERAGISNRAADPLLAAFVQPVEKTDKSNDLVSRKDLNARGEQFTTGFKQKTSPDDARMALTSASTSLGQAAGREKSDQKFGFEIGRSNVSALFEPSIEDLQTSRQIQQDRARAKSELSKLRDAQSKDKADASQDTKETEKAASLKDAKDKEDNGQHTEGIEPPTVSKGQLLLAQTAYQKARMREAVLQQTLNSQNRVSVVA